MFNSHTIQKESQTFKHSYLYFFQKISFLPYFSSAPQHFHFLYHSILYFFFRPTLTFRPIWLDIWIPTPPQVSIPKLLHPPFLLPHLLIPTSNPYNFILLLIDFQSLVCASPFKLSHKYSQLFSRFSHQHRIIFKKQNINIPFTLHISLPNTLPFSLHISNYTLHQYIK